MPFSIIQPSDQCKRDMKTQTHIMFTDTLHLTVHEQNISRRKCLYLSVKLFSLNITDRESEVQVQASIPGAERVKDLALGGSPSHQEKKNIQVQRRSKQSVYQHIVPVFNESSRSQPLFVAPMAISSP